jgi:N-acetylglucosaminyl-diphospho-decaprenol L-rhamnosyltransferase
VNRVAVVTVAAGRHRHLAAQQAALAVGSRLPDHRVVVAMADPGIREVVERTSGPTGLTEVVDVPVSPEGGLPLARARNRGAEVAIAAGADLVVFLDVDCLPAADLLASYAAAAGLDRTPDSSTAGGPRLLCGPVAYLPPLGAGEAGYTEEVLSRTEPHPGRPAPPPGVVERGGDVRLFWSLSFAVTSRDWARLGGFDECYVGYGAEDTDLGQRLRAAGGELWWVGGALAHHQWHPVSRPPVEHLHDIVRNANLFEERWGWYPMAGWLDGFETAGLASRDEAARRWTVRGSGVDPLEAEDPAEAQHRDHPERRTGGQQPEGVLPAHQLGDDREQLDRHHGEREPDRGLDGEGGADVPLVGGLAQGRGEHP